MFIPRVLSKTSFKLTELEVHICTHEWTAPKEYDSLVDIEWRNILNCTGRSMWDGTYYRVLNADEHRDGTSIGMRLGTIQYRYIATFPALHLHHARCRLEALNHLSTIALIRTGDDQYLFGRRVRDGSVDPIGGGVQRDEIEVACGADIERNLYKEIVEETGISDKDIEEIVGIGILISGTSNILIVGDAQTSLSQADVISKFARRTENEMSEPVFVSADSLHDFLHGMEDYRSLICALL